MENAVAQCLKAVLALDGLEPREGDLEQFDEIIQLYMSTLKALHSADLGAEEPGPVFRPEGPGK